MPWVRKKEQEKCFYCFYWVFVSLASSCVCLITQVLTLPSNQPLIIHPIPQNKNTARLEYGPFHMYLLLTAILSAWANSTMIMSGFFFPQALVVDMTLTEFETATLTAILFVGLFLGTLAIELLADKLGRRTTFLGFTLLTIVFGFSSGVAPDYVVLLLLRFGVGFGLAGTSAGFYALAELVPLPYRGRALLKVSFGWTLGSLLVPILGGLFLEGKNHWQVFLYVCTAPQIISLIVGYFLLPESPRWLMSRGFNTKALNVLRHAASVNKQDPWAICPQSAYLMRGGKSKSKWKAVAKLFRKEWRRMMICLLPTFLVVDFLYYSYVQMIHMALSDTDGDEDEFAFLTIALTALSEPLAIAMALFSIDQFGRVPTQAVSYVLGGILLMGMCIGRHFMDGSGKQTATSYLFFLAFLARFFIMTGTNVTWYVSTVS